jgi:hypothetical protein
VPSEDEIVAMVSPHLSRGMVVGATVQLDREPLGDVVGIDLDSE